MCYIYTSVKESPRVLSSSFYLLPLFLVDVLIALPTADLAPPDHMLIETFIHNYDDYTQFYTDSIRIHTCT